MLLQGKHILLGVTGSIAAYKAASLVRLFVKAGAEVRVIMTPSAAEFISPLTLSTLSKQPVHTSVIDEDSWNNHVELGLWADVMIVAPLTATTLGKMAHGICDSIVVATYLSARCPVMIAPAMDLDMWQHPATQSNISLLKSYGNHLIPVGDGELASGLHGPGRMAEPEDILKATEMLLKQEADLLGKTIIVTSGPTYEALDPVRFIGNHSTGKMGTAISEQLAARGANVLHISGPNAVLPQHPDIQVIHVKSAQQMHDAATEHFAQADAAILAAAVADFRPESAADQKIKKKPGQSEMTIHLVKTPDIAAALGQAKTKKQRLVGFALETQNEIENATKKLHKKNLDFIVLNSMADAGAGFGFDTNKVTIINRDETVHPLPLKSKKEVAIDIVDCLVRYLI